MALSLWASFRVKRIYRRYSDEPSISGLSGAEAARRMLTDEGITGVAIESARGELTDHYDPMRRRLVLSTGNYHGTSIAAIAVSAHEAGQALQSYHAPGGVRRFESCASCPDQQRNPFEHHRIVRY